ncbi:predicted protein [Lichtheimia corymbifera JMRC:FSU:9682]|uniref:EF-hand domain-containing protein n=1 Tax=Lichtheimia corymbifera JMRC:FSU:9682 TaxID=1263082 RepID=A0A068RUZ1_9FUNG|nr:predicted protein [Lichtheimia corymbifera JMRC:FSU:9682]
MQGYGSPQQQHPYGSPAPGYQQAPPPQGYQQQGYQQQQGQSPAIPPNANQQLYGWFKAVDTDGSGQLTADELQRALINGDWSPFNIETVRMMVNMFDKVTKRIDQETLFFLFIMGMDGKLGSNRYNRFQRVWWSVEVH